MHLRSKVESGRLSSVLALVLLMAASAWAQGTIKGQVKDAAGQVLAGANIQIQGTRLGAVADARGNYKIARVPAGTYTV